MTNEKAKKMLKAKLECFKNETSGINHDCNMRLCDGCSLNYEQGNMGEQKEALQMAIKALEQQPSREWKEIYAESEGSNSWIEFKCPHCGCSFGMESGEYDWHYGDEIPWKYCPICGGSAEHKPYKAESEDKE